MPSNPVLRINKYDTAWHAVLCHNHRCQQAAAAFVHTYGDTQLIILDTLVFFQAMLRPRMEREKRMKCRK